MGSNEKLWENAEHFFPERFADSEEKKAYMSFGLGPRNCEFFGVETN